MTKVRKLRLWWQCRYTGGKNEELKNSIRSKSIYMRADDIIPAGRSMRLRGANPDFTLGITHEISGTYNIY